MRKIKSFIPLLIAVAVVGAAITIAGCASSDTRDAINEAPPAATNTPVVQTERPTPVSQEETPTTAAPREEATVPPTPESQDVTPAPDSQETEGGSSDENEGLSEVLKVDNPLVRDDLKGRGEPAGEIAGIVAWINSEPLTISELRGKVVLIDFWTYTCVNCIRTLPYLKLWHAKYADDGLVILGVHTPEFDIEKKLENVQRAVEDYGVGWAVAMDNDYTTWNVYENRYWPAKYLIDKDGIIRYKHFGEGRYAETESEIRTLLEEAGADLSQLDANLPDDQSLDQSYLDSPSAEITRELYAGWRRGYNDFLYGRGGFVGNWEYYYGIPGSGLGNRESTRDTVITYEDPGEPNKHLLYLQGPWYSGRESLRHDRETSGFEDYMRLLFAAKSVNAVIGPEGPEGAEAEPFKVLVTLDEEYLTDSNKGEDVVIEEDGRSFLYVDEPKMYSLIQAPAYDTYSLKLSSNSPNFTVFAFTFGVYESGV